MSWASFSPVMGFPLCVYRVSFLCMCTVETIYFDIQRYKVYFCLFRGKHVDIPSGREKPFGLLIFYSLT